jgi:phosphohistidine phosphatase SixA
VETAHLFCQEAGVEGTPEVTPGLLPGDPIDPWMETANENSEDLLLVGHNPFMGDLASQLAGHPVGFDTAALVVFQRQEDGGWELLEVV